MPSPQDAFNKRIDRFLKEQPDSDSASIIKRVQTAFPNYHSYYSLFDEAAFVFGIGFFAQEVIGGRADKTIGYLPTLKYYPENKIEEEPRNEGLISISSPLSEEESYEYLAKELVYRLARVKNFDEILGITLPV